MGGGSACQRFVSDEDEDEVLEWSCEWSRIVDAYVKVMSVWVKRAIIASTAMTLGARPNWPIRELELSMAMMSAALLVSVIRGGKYG